MLAVASFSAFDDFLDTLDLTTLLLFSSLPTAGDFVVVVDGDGVGFGNGFAAATLVRGFWHLTLATLTTCFPAMLIDLSFCGGRLVDGGVFLTGDDGGGGAERAIFGPTAVLA